jgi:molecular chaperone GrpE (heat shock protein)
MNNSTNATFAPSSIIGESPDLAKWFETCADMLYEASSIMRQREQLVAQQHQNTTQSLLCLEQAAARQEEKWRLFGQRLGDMEQLFSSLPREITKNADSNARILQRLDTIDHNLEQVRLLADTTVQKQQALVDDFIERRVTDHLFREFLNIQFALARYSANGNPNLKGDIQSIAEAIEAFLTESGLRIIHPLPGAAFEPREHQPVKVVSAEYGQGDGTIAETFTPGLSRSHRVIQPARVAVFKANGVKNTV